MAPSRGPGPIPWSARGIALVALVTGACRPVEGEGDDVVDLDAPDSLSDVLDLAWLRFDEGGSALAPAVHALVELVDEEALLDGHVEGGQRRFGPEHLGVIELFAPADDDGSWRPPDPAKARPLFIVNRFTCDLDQLARVLAHRDQGALYDDAYVTYARTWLGDGTAFLAGDADALDWKVHLTSKYPGAGEFTEDLLGGVRRMPLPDVPGARFDGEHWLATRTWLPFPAARDNDKIAFDQDYQLELYVPWGDGDIVHLYGIWRQLDTPFGDFEGDLVPRLTLTNLVKWDDQTEALCAEGRP